ncbi:hypothetical protein AB1Y20_001705 [Prymnesium parvum]|uniref:Mitochondrial pyruvate carrier n=1 Tax=Prymnesium parvum TaxID=97485 RepID=A0AB34KA74_PRYPA
MPVTIPASHPLALGTAFLGWATVVGTGPGGVTSVLLNTGQMLAAFVSARLSCSKTPADRPAADQVNPLTIGLTGTAWTRILNEYIASGLLDRLSWLHAPSCSSALVLFPLPTRNIFSLQSPTGSLGKIQQAPLVPPGWSEHQPCLQRQPSVAEDSEDIDQPSQAYMRPVCCS